MKFEDLMIGMRVKVVEDEENDNMTIDYLGLDTKITGFSCGRYVMLEGVDGVVFSPEELERSGLTLETLQEGDTVEDDGTKRDVLAVLGGSGEKRVYVMSEEYEEDGDSSRKRAEELFTAFELEDCDFEPVQIETEEAAEMTMEEVCKELGRNVKIKK